MSIKKVMSDTDVKSFGNVCNTHSFGL